MDVFCMNINPLLKHPDKLAFLKLVYQKYAEEKEEKVEDFFGGTVKINLRLGSHIGCLFNLFFYF